MISLAEIKIATSFATANGAVLYTVPPGQRIYLERIFHEVTADWTGGVASTVGCSSSNAKYNTAGDLLGAAAGDAAANMTAALKFTGTLGTKLALALNPVVLVGGDQILWNRIVSAFAAGTGFLHVPCWRVI